MWANFSTQIFADVAYVNSVVAAGAANASETVKGIIQLATGAQAALGTSLGTTGARLALGNNLATSTPTASCTSGCIPVAVNSKISQLFLDLTQAFTFSGLNTFTAGFLSTASSTITATTTIAASSVTNNALVLNSVKYAFPSSQGALNTYLVNNGSGVLSWGLVGAQQYSLASTTQSLAGQGKTITSASLNIPAGVLTASSTAFMNAMYECQTSGSGGNCTMSIVDTNSNTYFSLQISPGTTATCYVSLIFHMSGNGISAQNNTTTGLQTCGSGSTSAFTDVTQNDFSSANFANATSFQVKIVTSNTSGVSGYISPFILTVTP